MPKPRKTPQTKPNQGADHIVEAEVSFARYFTILPHIIDDDKRLSPYDVRLLYRYMRVCGQQNKPCRQGVRRLSEDLSMSVGKLSECRLRLEKFGYIQCRQIGQNMYVTVVDKMAENVAKYDPKSVHDMNALSPRGRPKTVHDMNSTVHEVNRRRTRAKKQQPLPPDGGAGNSDENISLPKQLTPVQIVMRKVVRSMLAPVRRISDEQLELFLKGELQIDGVYKPSKTDFSLWMRTAKELVQKGVMPEDVWLIHKYCAETFTQFTAAALVKHADAALAAHQAAQNTPSTVPSTVPKKQ